MTHAVMTINLTGPQGPEVTVGSLIKRGQWVEFYGLLAMDRTDPVRSGEYLSPERLYAMAQWSHGKQLDSVGKEVARHCKELEKHGLAHVLEYRYRTRFWRLAIAADQIELIDGRPALARWLASRTLTLPSDDAWLDELEALVHGQLAVARGEGSEACEQLRRFRAFSLPEFEAWAALIDARGTDQHVDGTDNPLVLDELAAHWSEHSDIAGRSVAARIQARNALRKRHTQLELEYQHASVGRLAADLEQRGDVGALASVTNVLGILTARLGRPKEAVRQFLRAIALFGIVGDPNSLQAALFNLANSYVRQLREQQRKPDHHALRIADLGIDFSLSYSVGCDSIQAETSACQWAIEMGHHERARMYLQHAERAVDSIDSAYDQGCFLLTRALFESAARTGEYDVLRDLRRARRAFEAAGDQREAARVRDWIERLERATT